MLCTDFEFWPSFLLLIAFVFAYSGYTLEYFDEAYFGRVERVSLVTIDTGSVYSFAAEYKKFS